MLKEIGIRRDSDDVYSLFERFDDGRSGMAVDVADDGDAFVVTADLSGFDEDDASVSLRDRTLAIEAAGETVSENAGDDEGMQCVRRERSSGSFARSVQLPAAVSADDVRAELRNGVLRITLPKTDQRHREPGSTFADPIGPVTRTPPDRSC